MCTLVVSIDPAAEWPVLLLSVRDELRRRPFDLPRAWWEGSPHVVGPRDRHAGGTWLAVDTVQATAAIVLNRTRQRPQATASRGLLPLVTLRDRGDVAALARSAAPANVVALAGHEWSWLRSDDDASPQWLPIAPGWHIVTSHDLDDPIRPKHAAVLAQFTEVGRPPADGVPDWTEWKRLVARDWEALDVEHRLTIDVDPDRPGYGTTAVTLVGIGRDRSLTMEFCDSHPARGEWHQWSWPGVDESQAAAAGRRDR